MFIFMLLICHVRGVCIDESSSNNICFLLFGGFFTPNTKMMELMEQDAQLLKTFFYFTSLICICDALIQVGQKTKRKQIFNFLEKKQFKICLLQETHSKPDFESLWKRECKNHIFFSGRSSNSGGVCILVEKLLQFK